MNPNIRLMCWSEEPSPKVSQIGTYEVGNLLQTCFPRSVTPNDPNPDPNPNLTFPAVAMFAAKQGRKKSD